MYIRTKDGRILDFDKLNEVSKLSIDMAEEPIRESENLEELCDGFYIDKCKEEFLLDEMFDDYWYDFNLYFKDCAKSGIDVYGFIKTDKGLIFVAKMNDKGDLDRYETRI